MADEVLVVNGVQTLVIDSTGDTVVSERGPTQLLEVAGKQGPPGGQAGALLEVNRLSEFNTEQKKHEARVSLGLEVIDGGTFN